MFMAAPANPACELALFDLVLEMVEQQQDFDRPSFEQYFDRLLKSALAVAENPSSAGSTLTPEAIQLALAIARDGRLAEELRRLKGARDLSAESAARIRKSVELQLAA